MFSFQCIFLIFSAFSSYSLLAYNIMSCSYVIQNFPFLTTIPPFCYFFISSSRSMTLNKIGFITHVLILSLFRTLLIFFSSPLLYSLFLYLFLILLLNCSSILVSFSIFSNFPLSTLSNSLEINMKYKEYYLFLFLFISLFTM